MDEDGGGGMGTISSKEDIIHTVQHKIVSYTVQTYFKGLGHIERMCINVSVALASFDSGCLFGAFRLICQENSSQTDINKIKALKE